MRAGALLLCLGLSATGCAGARTMVLAERSEYPVSLSRGLRDPDGKLVTPDRRKVVGTFSTSRTAWNLLWAAVKLTPEMDISDEVNQQVAAAHGDAIIHLTVVTTHCALNYFAFPMGILPFWPSCANIDIHGDIVKVEEGSPVAQPAEATNASNTNTSNTGAGSTQVAAQMQAPPRTPSQPPLPATAAVATANDSALGNVGESCRARSDCKAGLACTNKKCARESHK